MTFNEKIDNFMVDNNISNLKQLAISSNIPYTTLKDFYDKKSADNSRLSTIRKLAKYMGCSMDYLAYDDIIDFNDKKEIRAKVQWFNDTTNNKVDENKLDNILTQYQYLFDKDDRLTEDQKKFFMDFLSEKHKEFDEKMNK